MLMSETMPFLLQSGVKDWRSRSGPGCDSGKRLNMAVTLNTSPRPRAIYNYPIGGVILDLGKIMV